MSDDTEKQTASNKKEAKIKKSSKAAMSKGKKKSSSSSSKILFNEEIEIYSSEELKQFSNSFAKAYRAVNLRDGSDCIAYICDKAYTPRSRSSGSFVSILHASLARLIASGVVYWPEAGMQKYTFIYHNTLGQCIVKDSTKPCVGWKSDFVMSKVVFPLIDVLMDMHNIDMVHGAVHPANIFNGGSDDFDAAILGGCLSAPAFSTLPVIYETIDRGAASPLGRGTGTHGNDLYSLGVTAAMLMHTVDPYEGMSDKEIVKNKMSEGSFVSIIGKERITGPILEFLRGVLNDDPRERWTISEANEWKEGRRLSPKQGTMKRKSNRPIKFNEQAYAMPSALCLDLDEKPTEAMQLVEGGDLEQWLLRSLENKQAAEVLEMAVNDARKHGRSIGYMERLLCRVSSALDPTLPVRYKGIVAMPEGVGACLAEAFAKDQNLRSFYDVFNQETFGFWATCNPDSVFDTVSTINRFEACKGFIRQELIGYGLERCLYYLNPESPCMSLILKDYYVRSPEELLLAFEDMCQKKKPRFLMDRHIVAFIASKESSLIEGHLSGLNSKDNKKQILATLRVLSMIQRRARMGELPNLCAHMDENLAPVYELYHDRDMREKLKKDIRIAIKQGDLHKIVSIIDNGDNLNSDARQFEQSMHEYHNLQKEHMALTKGLESKKTFGKVAGQEVAVLAAFILSTIMVLGFIVISIGAGGGANFIPG